ncbi:MAG: YqgE/AlgH family protein [Paracoccaceae bacterium]
MEQILENVEPPPSGMLDGKLLIAMPGMADPRFEKTVIFLCAHTDDGALGIVVNRRAGNVRREDLFRQLDIVGIATVGDENAWIHYGGPVETERGFVLHSPDWRLEEATLEVDDDFSMTATIDVLHAIAEERGPRRVLIALGYAGWTSGQLEGELRENGWLTCDADEEIVFGRDDATKWEAALAKLGIDPMLLSAAGGTA